MVAAMAAAAAASVKYGLRPPRVDYFDPPPRLPPSHGFLPFANGGYY